MEQLNVSRRIQKWFLLSGLLLLLAGMSAGVIGSIQYVVPGFLKTSFSFEKIRPLHVSSVVFWILLAAMGTVLVYVQESTGRKIWSERLIKIQLALFLSSILLILTSYVLGIFGGREYWEFPPVLALPVAVGWLLFVINLLFTVKILRGQPVYIWMWFTGGIGFLFTFTESYLWILPYFQRDIVRDMTVQWKSYGSMVGCWNMLVYGAGICLMERISGDRSYGRSPMGFLLFFLGLTNLLFNWSHHIYTLPVDPMLRHIGYGVSMTELFILGRIIYKWKAALTDAQKFSHLLPYRFMMSADLWVFLNLTLAILMSIPAINVYTHGTHITVAHVMGTTIGINTMLLLAVTFDVLEGVEERLTEHRRRITGALVVGNISLGLFLVSLVMAGIKRSQWQMAAKPVAFSEMMKSLVPYFIGFAMAGFILFASFVVIVLPIIKTALQGSVKPKPVATARPEIVTAYAQVAKENQREDLGL